jgi:hypothetical protein
MSPRPAWRERERRVGNARTTLIDALRLADSGQFDEALVGCALAIVFLEPLTSRSRVEGLIEGIVANSRELRSDRLGAQHEEKQP